MKYFVVFFIGTVQTTTLRCPQLCDDVPDICAVVDYIEQQETFLSPIAFTQVIMRVFEKSPIDGSLKESHDEKLYLRSYEIRKILIDAVHYYDVYIDGEFCRTFLLRENVRYTQALELLNRHQGRYFTMERVELRRH